MFIISGLIPITLHSWGIATFLQIAGIIYVLHFDMAKMGVTSGKYVFQNSVYPILNGKTSMTIIKSVIIFPYLMQ